MMVGMDKERIYQGISILESQSRGLERNLSIVEDYEISNVSEKVLRIIQSYTDYVNRAVWKKILTERNSFHANCRHIRCLSTDENIRCSSDS